jgi:hypothetical protein
MDINLQDWAKQRWNQSGWNQPGWNQQNWDQPGWDQRVRQLDAVERPPGWAPIVLRFSLGMVGSLLTALSLWGLMPPPL